MDEVVFRTSQRVDNLQYHLKLAADEGKHVILHLSEKVKGATLNFIENPKYNHILQFLKKVGVVAITLYKESKETVTVHFKILLRKVFKLLGKNVSTRDILIGSTGLLVGAVIGFLISYTFPKRQNVLRCMRAIQSTNYSGVEAVALVEDAFGIRDCGKNEVLINVKAASLNLIDIEISKGYGALIRQAIGTFYKTSYGNVGPCEQLF
ncbi:hypothetical protein QE152_g3975 [Popillia japonica]|uniref:Uncharacterized protein n=1 Tax=Popillia japonica TaxID=7064 RepID=A0AAW1N1S7_POPJA